MKTIFDQSVRKELLNRITKLNSNNTAQWGKMNVSQMTKHCTFWNDWVLGRKPVEYKQEFLGKIFGKMGLRANTKNDKPIGRNMPAGKAFIIKDSNIDFAFEKSQWAEQITAYENYSNDAFIHDFFGKMTRDQIGIFAYKHNDHHLRQFGV